MVCLSERLRQSSIYRTCVAKAVQGTVAGQIKDRPWDKHQLSLILYVLRVLRM
jgi:hypothetical protein